MPGPPEGYLMTATSDMPPQTRDAAIFKALLVRENWLQYGPMVRRVLWLSTNLRQLYRHLGDLHERTTGDLTIEDVAVYVGSVDDSLAVLVRKFEEAPPINDEVLREFIKQSAARSLSFQAAEHIMAKHMDHDFDPSVAADMLQDARNAIDSGAQSKLVLDLQDSGEPDLALDRPNLQSLGLSTRLDQLVGGGVAAGEVCVFLAGPKRGKTSLLSYIGAMAGLKGQRVLHFTLENPPQMAARRYDSALLGYNYNELLMNPMKLQRARLRISEAGGFCKIINWQYQEKSPAEITPFAREYGADLIIVDYLQKMVPNGTKTYGRWEKRHLFDKLGNDICQVAADLGVGIVTAWQTNREGDAADTVTEHHVSESWSIMQHASTIIGVSAVSGERRENLRRIHTLLSRYSDKQGSVRFDVDLERNQWKEK